MEYFMWCVIYGVLCMEVYVCLVMFMQCPLFSVVCTLLCVHYFMSIVLCLGVCCYMCVFVLSDLLVLCFVWFVLFFDTVCSMRKIWFSFGGFKRVCIQKGVWLSLCFVIFKYHQWAIPLDKGDRFGFGSKKTTMSPKGFNDYCKIYMWGFIFVSVSYYIGRIFNFV